MKVTIKKIAEEAGVSVTSVSNVINNKAHRVSKEKRELINAIIKKYNYSPNMNARALVQSSSRLIGLLYYSQKPRLDFSDPFVTDILEGIESLAKPQGFFTLVHNVSSVKDIEDIQKNWKFDGLIAVGFNQTLFEKIHESISVPIVFIDTHLDQEFYHNISNYPDRYFINTDDRLMGTTATEFLIENHHQQIAFLSYGFDEQEPSVIQQRYLGYKEALKNRHLAFLPELVYTDEEFDKLLADQKKYTAVFVTADYLAMQFIQFMKKNKAFREIGLSVISLDDIKYAQLNDPPLTTIRLDQVRKGRLAMEKIEKLVKEKAEVEQMTVLPGQLIIRETVQKRK
ncbi:LacI family DNA-binding transcriptional regulator [Enterococcus sp. 2201sp1_2201st1_B8_2201SCRN_220225]|uniref:LacI family DNA-binding transcriptional regulator n=1 Tax=unclassified Enterococcus TaxID=2608891 RepID=UPI0034A34EF6